MGRYATATAAVLTVVVAAGCSAGGGESSDARHPQPSGTASAGPNKKISVSEALRLPKHPKFLVKIREGVGSQTLPDFTPGKDVYTVHIKCSGSKKLKIVFRGNPKNKPTVVRCDVPVTVGQIYTDPGKEKLDISASDRVHWTLAIVDGKYAL